MSLSTWIPRVTVHSFIVVASVLIYILTTRAERERRPPSIAIAWVLGMLALPYLVLPMYLMFGRRKLQRVGSRRIGARPDTGHWAEDLIESFGLAPSAPASVHLHQDGRESAAALFAVMSSATGRLDVCTYILGDDDFGREAIRRMVDRARAGLEVRFLLDGVGALQLPRAAACKSICAFPPSRIIDWPTSRATAHCAR